MCSLIDSTWSLPRCNSTRLLDSCSSIINYSIKAMDISARVRSKSVKAILEEFDLETYIKYVAFRYVDFSKGLHEYEAM